jgi:hypothetical protein
MDEETHYRQQDLKIKRCDVPTTDAIQMFAQSLENTGMRPTILPLLTKLYSQLDESSGNTCTDSEKSVKQQLIQKEYGILEQKLLHICENRGDKNLSESHAVILADLSHTQEEINSKTMEIKGVV